MKGSASDRGGPMAVTFGESAAATPRALVVGLVAVVVLVVAAHAPMLAIHPWGDDFENLRLAYSIHESPWRALQPNYLFFRPVMLLSMYLEYRLWGSDPVGYNLVTLLLLVGNVLLVAGVARRLGLGIGAVLAAALLYGTSPLMAEATTWSGTRADQLMVAWSLLLILAALAAWRPTSWRFQVVTGGLLTVAACTKESWVVLPVVLGILLLAVRRERLRDTVLACAFGGALVVAYGLYFVVWPKLAGLRTPLDYSAEVNSPLQAGAKLLRIVAWFGGLGHPAISGAWGVVGGAVIAGVLIALALRRRRRDALFALALAVLPLVPTLHFPVSPTRYNALPLVGFWIAVVALAVDLADGRRAWRWAIVGFGACVVVLQVFMLRLEIADYRWYGELHRQLVNDVREVEPLLSEPGVVVVLNAGRFDGPGAFQRAVRGMPKYIYPKPGGMWDLIFFPSLAEFAGRPFEVRVRPLPADRIMPQAVASATVLLFEDSGFSPCEECRDEVLRRVVAGETLPDRVGVYEVVRVQRGEAVAAAAASPLTP